MWPGQVKIFIDVFLTPSFSRIRSRGTFATGFFVAARGLYIKGGENSELRREKSFHPEKEPSGSRGKTRLPFEGFCFEESKRCFLLLLKVTF